MDGRNAQKLIESGLHWPNGITIDEQTSRLYWTDAYLDRIEMAYLDGTHREVLLSENVPHPYAIGVYKVITLFFCPGTRRGVLSYWITYQIYHLHIENNQLCPAVFKNKNRDSEMCFTYIC